MWRHIRCCCRCYGFAVSPSGIYRLYAWGNFIDETGLDRLDDWIDPEVLSGDRIVENSDVTVYETDLRIDGSRTYYLVDDEYVVGRDLVTPGDTWRAAYLCLATDGTLDDALRLAAQFEDDLARDDNPSRNPLPIGEVVAVWEDPCGQWDLALVLL